MGQPMFFRQPSRRFMRVALATSFLYGSSVSGANLAYQLNVGAGHSDNVARTETNEIEEDIASAGLQFSLDQSSSRLQTDLVGNFAYYDYLDDTFDSEFLGNFVGNVAIDFVPERFQWVVSDNFGQVLTDAFQPATPENREYINYLTTGPNIMMSFGSQTRLRLGARYSTTDYEDSPFDSVSTLGELQIARLLSSAVSLSLNARVSQTEYDEELLNADYDRTEAFLRYDAAGARTFLTVDAGYTEIERDATSETEDGSLFRISVSRRVSPSSIVSLTGGREFSSSGEAFASTQVGGGVDLGAAPGRQTVDPFTNEFVTLGWTYERSRTGIDLFGSRSKQSYDDRPLLDQTLVDISAGVHRDLSPTVRIRLQGAYSEGSFAESGSDYDEMSGGLTLSWRLSRSLSLGLTYNHYDRTSDAVDGGYTENRYWLSLNYSRGEPRARERRTEFAVDAVNSEI